MSLKIGQGSYGEVGTKVSVHLAAKCLLCDNFVDNDPYTPESDLMCLLIVIANFSSSCVKSIHPVQTWMGSWSGHTVVVKKLKTTGDVFRSGLRESFHHEYQRLRIFNHDNVLPLIGVIMEPQVHTIGIHMKLGSLFHILHELDSGESVGWLSGVLLPSLQNAPSTISITV